jgi:hypothetical protein
MVPARLYTRTLALLLLCANATADEVRAQIGVSARVMPVASLQWLGATPTLRISTADVARGSVTISQAAQLRVSSNSRVGYAIDVQPRLTIFSAIIINGLPAPAHLGPQGGAITRRWPGNQRDEDLQLYFSFQLTPETAPGDYPWPVALQVRPLESF